MKTKIISERIHTQFEEIKEEKSKETENEEEEESLEEEIIPEEPESFIDFTTETASPVLESMPIPDISREPLERELEKTPSTFRTERTPETGYTVYNMPEYGREYETSERERHERGVEIRNLSASTPERDTLALRQSTEQELSRLSEGERIERDIRKYEELKRIEEIEGTRRLPFERRERKRERILK